MSYLNLDVEATEIRFTEYDEKGYRIEFAECEIDQHVLSLVEALKQAIRDRSLDNPVAIPVHTPIEMLEASQIEDDKNE